MGTELSANRQDSGQGQMGSPLDAIEAKTAAAKPSPAPDKQSRGVRNFIVVDNLGDFDVLIYLALDARLYFVSFGLFSRVAEAMDTLPESREAMFRFEKALFWIGLTEITPKPGVNASRFKKKCCFWSCIDIYFSSI